MHGAFFGNFIAKCINLLRCITFGVLPVSTPFIPAMLLNNLAHVSCHPSRTAYLENYVIPFKFHFTSVNMLNAF